MELELKRIQQENMQLLGEARTARAYRDELDALREKAIRVDKLESEVGRYKERLHEFEFYRTRVEELKEDNQVLLETKTMLEDQLAGSWARADKLHELEKENLQLKAKLHDLEMDRDMDRKRIEELLEENLSLEMAQKQSMEESLHLGWELEQLSKTPEHTEVPQKSLGHEVNELTSSRLLKLEKENQALLKTVEELKGTTNPEDSAVRLLKAEKENQRLTEKLEQLESELNAEKQSLQSAESLSGDLMKEKAQLERTLETLQENSERQVKVLEQENEHLNKTIASLRQRSQISAEARVKDVETENRVLHESIKETSNKLSKLEFERRQLRKDLEYYKEKGERAEELELEVHRLQRENEGLQKRVAALGITCEKVETLERENVELEAEGRRLKKKLDSFRNTAIQLEALEKENSQLEEENLELRRTTEALRSAGTKAAQLELENRELESERSQLKRSLELLKASSKKTERLEMSCQGLDTENQRLQKALENSSRKIQHLEGELHDVETENQSLQRNLEELKISSKRLEQLEKENKVLEQETSQLEKDKKQLEKENKWLRQQAEIRDSKLDEDNLRIVHLEKENRSLNKEMSIFKDSCSRMKDLEKENKELVKQATIDKKTLVTLREELVNEKLKTQQMNNDLEKLTHELEKIGLNKERLLHDEQSSDDRYKLLESKLESTMKKSLEIKEEKIAALEARLQESSNLNQQLRQELKTVKKNYEALRQREEEERMMQSSPPRVGEKAQVVSKWEKESHEATRELLKVKDRLIEVERNVENSTLNSQSAALLAQNAQLQSQQSSTESEKESAVREREELRATYELLLRDHEKLAALHERQAIEYEALISKHGGLKSAHKSLELEHRELEDRYNQLLKQKAQLEELETVLKKEQEKMVSESKSHEATAAQYHKLKDENDRLNQKYLQLLKDNEGLQADHKNLKSQLNSSKLEQTRLEADFSKLKEQYQQLDITSTKLTNQCELLSQLKGNLEEENRHLLDQIQTLMLQNRTLLEQTMESKDLFHVEQRQYIDKLNELRRQKEKLEEKIMDQYKFYDPSPPRRRGNWITLKMKKLIKPKSRDRIRSLTLTPTRSESNEGFPGLPPADSQDSSSMGSLDDSLSHKRSSTMNDLLQSMALAGGPWAGSSENLDEPEEAANRQRLKELGSMAYSTTAINYATLNLPSGHRSKQRLKAKVCPCSYVHPASRPTSKSNKITNRNSNSNSHSGAMNGNHSRPQSESSGEFSLSLDNEGWSSGSSPVQQPLSQRSSRQSPLPFRKSLEPPSAQARKKAASPGSEVMSLQQFLEESGNLRCIYSYLVYILCTCLNSFLNLLSEFIVRMILLSCLGILRSASGRTVPTDSSADSRTLKSGHGSIGRPNLRKAESTRVKGSAQVRPTLSVQSKANSVSDRLDASASTLPRASSVISTAEGSSRRTSIHDFMSKDTRMPVSVDPSPSKARARSQAMPSEYPSCTDPQALPHCTPSQAPYGPSALPKSTSLPLAGSDPQKQGPALSSLESFLGSTFTVDSVFMDTIFSEPVFNSTGKSQTFLSLNTSLVSNISGVPVKPAPWPGKTEHETQQNMGLSPSPPVQRANDHSVIATGPETADPQAPTLTSEDSQSLWYEYGCV
uniref:Coiled-coil domain containing 88A n=1 Tax=Scleropages formosus TaxID=113540 RepID=A0A8C9TPB8_SCLFO